MKTFDTKDISALLHLVEQSVHRTITGPQDFTFLSDIIYKRTHAILSISTLKRLWGYSKTNHKPYYTTLCVLARFVGYKDYADFVSHKEDVHIIPSFNYTAHSLKSSDLVADDRVILQWKPCRLCEIVYLGDNCFEVVESQNTKLSKGDNFRAMLFTEGIPAYLDDLRSEHNSFGTYIIGWNGGLSKIKVIKSASNVLSDDTQLEKRQDSNEQAHLQ